MNQLFEAGEEVEILRSGEPIAKIVRIRSRRERALGFDEGRLVIPDDFDEPLPEDVLESFYR